MFGAAFYYWGMGTAVAVTAIYSLVELLYRRARKIPLTELFMISVVGTILFGTIQMYAPTVPVIDYEPILTNIFAACFFLVGAFSENSLIHEVAAQRNRYETFFGANTLVRTFRAFMVLFSVYFFIRAGFYLWILTQPASSMSSYFIQNSLLSGRISALLAFCGFGVSLLPKSSHRQLLAQA